MSAASHRVLGAQAMQPLSDRPEVAIPYLLKCLHHSLRQAVDEALREQKIDMSFAHMVTMYNIESAVGLTGAELARRCFVTPQTMNSLLRSLEEGGDIERRPHPVNQRADTWYLTHAGQARMVKAKMVGEKIWAQLLSPLAAREAEQLKMLLKRCIEGIDPPAEPASRPSSTRKRAPTMGRSSKR